MTGTPSRVNASRGCGVLGSSGVDRGAHEHAAPIRGPDLSMNTAGCSGFATSDDRPRNSPKRTGPCAGPDMPDLFAPERRTLTRARSEGRTPASPGAVQGIRPNPRIPHPEFAAVVARRTNVCRSMIMSTRLEDHRLRTTSPSGIWLTHAEGVELGQAMLARAAQDAGVRAFAIKGPVTALHGLRAPVLSADVDLWIDPSCRQTLFTHLEALGWIIVEQTQASRLMPLHAAIATHPNWPVQLDLHWRFPGFLAAEQDVFEELWRRHQSVTIAGVSVPCSDPVASAAIYALSLIRDRSTRGPQLELFLSLVSSWTTGNLEELVDLATITGSVQTLEPVLEPLGIRPLGPHGSNFEHELRQWDLRARSTGVSGVAQLAELQRTPVHRWPRIVWRNIMLTAEEIRALDPNTAGRRFGIARTRTRRAVRAAYALPRAFRVVAKRER